MLTENTPENRCLLVRAVVHNDLTADELVGMLADALHALFVCSDGMFQVYWEDEFGLEESET